VQASGVKILPNGIAVIEGDTHISKWVEESGRLDHDQYALPIILEHIEEGHLVVDAGAFIGDHTRSYLDKVGAGGIVMAFEPNPEAFECLVYNCPEADTIPFGLSDASTPARLGKRANAGASMIGDEGEFIQLDRLDNYGLKQLDFLKLDVEGYEMNALEGARNTIAHFRPKMWIEINEYALNQQDCSPREIYRFLEGFNYEIIPYPEDNIPQYDILCIPQ